MRMSARAGRGIWCALRYGRVLGGQEFGVRTGAGDGWRCGRFAGRNDALRVRAQNRSVMRQFASLAPTSRSIAAAGRGE